MRDIYPYDLYRLEIAQKVNFMFDFYLYELADPGVEDDVDRLVVDGSLYENGSMSIRAQDFSIEKPNRSLILGFILRDVYVLGIEKHGFRGYIDLMNEEPTQAFKILSR